MGGALPASCVQLPNGSHQPLGISRARQEVRCFLHRAPVGERDDHHGLAAVARDDNRGAVLDHPVRHLLQARAGIGVGDNVHARIVPVFAQTIKPLEGRCCCGELAIRLSD